jgi:hypothetical protein
MPLRNHAAEPDPRFRVIHKLRRDLFQACGQVLGCSPGCRMRPQGWPPNDMVQGEVSTSRARTAGEQTFEVCLVDKTTGAGCQARCRSGAHGACRGARHTKTQAQKPGPEGLRPTGACGPWHAVR